MVAVLSGCGGGSGGGTGRVAVPTPTPTPTATPIPLVGDYFNTRFPHWGTFPIKVKFDATSGITPDVQRSLQQGMDAWKSASGGRLSYQVVTSGDAEVVVSFGAVGTTLHGLCQGTWFDDGTIINMNITLSAASKDANPATQARVMAHEWGHALGLIDTVTPFGHSDNPADRMYPVLLPAADGSAPILSARDQNTIRRLYNL